MTPAPAIGVFDSGMGGLSILQALRAELPQENFIYVADSGFAPYGERDEAHVLARAQAVSAQLVARSVKALVIACNTATAVAIERLRTAYPGLPIIGVEPALKPAVALSRTRHIGVMATRATLASAKFQALLHTYQDQAQWRLQPCDGLADAIERSAQSGDAAPTLELCQRYIAAMAPFGSAAGQIDTLVLGCTHYPFASAHLRTLVGPQVQLVSTGEAVARQTRRLLGNALRGDQDATSGGPSSGSGSGRIELISTGQAHTLEAAARRWLGLSDAAHRPSV